MGVVRARVTFPYKVGHFVTWADPLRADLVKIRDASRDPPVRCLGCCQCLVRCLRGARAARSRAWRRRDGGLAGDCCIGGPRQAQDISAGRGWTWISVWVDGYIYIYLHTDALLACTDRMAAPPTRYGPFGMHGRAARPDRLVQGRAPHRPVPTGENNVTCRDPRRPSPHGELASSNHGSASPCELASIPSRDARRRRLGLAGSGVSPHLSPPSPCACLISPFDRPAPKSHPAANWPPPPPPAGRHPRRGPDARPPIHRPGSRPLAREVPEADETSSHGRTGAGPPALAPRRHARAPHARRSPSDPPPQRPSPRPVDWPGSPLHILPDPGWADGCHAIVPAREMCCQGQG